MPIFYRRYNNFSPFLALINELNDGGACKPQPQRRSFSPRFDVTERQDSYELVGELPGIDKSNINVEWADEKTLVISGSTQQSTKGKTSESSETAKASTKDATESPDTVSSQQPTVEDDPEDGESWTSVDHLSEKNEVAAVPTKESEASAVQDAPKGNPQYIYTERSKGSFKRTFTFTRYVDHEAVKARLENGILTLTVPKTHLKQPGPIAIQ